MGNLAYFKPNTDLWDDWVTTYLTAAGQKMLIGGKSSWDMFGINELDAAYPGFTASVDLLTGMGCDDNFITEMLKFCIVQAGDPDLYSTLTHPGRLERIKSALVIGLTGKELVPLLEGVADSLPNIGLPEDLVFKSHI